MTSAKGEKKNSSSIGEETRIPKALHGEWQFYSICHPGFPRRYQNHDCNPNCLKDTPEPNINGLNSLTIPLTCGWRRVRRNIRSKPKSATRHYIVYTAPCGKNLSSIKDVNGYLLITSSILTIDLFCFDFRVRCTGAYVNKNVLMSLPDLSYSNENVPVPCVNNLSIDFPDFVQYSQKRISPGVNINFDPNFLVCCDCEDNCSDPSACACQKLTQETFIRVFPYAEHYDPGYKFRRLDESVATGIYECNSRCRCNIRCLNRVVQQKTSLRLQVFKTDSCGWGLKCLDDLPEGCFIAIYSGILLHDNRATEDGNLFGDEYFVELNIVEACESMKDGFEDDVIPPEEDSFLKKCDLNVEKCAISPRESNGSTAELNGNDKKAELIGNDKNVELNGNDKNAELNGNDKNDGEKFCIEKYLDDDCCYIVDGKYLGNVSRYMNHSCDPNVFVQNVFVDTHDIRFPWLGFFTSKYVSAGTELTWDYGYKVGSVPDKVIVCKCGAKNCRQRLL